MMKKQLFKLIMLALCGIITFSLTACSDDDSVTIGNITIAESELTKSVPWDEIESSITFTATSKWTATVSDATSRAGNTEISWLKLTVNSGEADDVKMPFLLTKNDAETYREAQIEIKCDGSSPVTITVHQEANPDAVHILDASTIKDYDKYYCPSSYNEGFEKGASNMLRSDAKWSWWRMKQSEHFFLFWEPGFGDDPNAETVPEALRVDTDDLLAKAEQFYQTNVEKLKMVTVGEGKSYLDKYKMQIYLLYQTSWLATGSGYDDTIGALWVNPSTCQPVGSTIGHEIGHSFQFQCGSDKLLTGEVSNVSEAGFRYGFDAAGSAGCPYWEQCAQWQSFQDYPEEAFTQDANVNVWKANHHRHFNHEWQRYASYWLQYYLTQKHGIEAYSALWKESKFPEDPIDVYTRLYCDNNIEKFYDEYYDYAARCITYDFDAVHKYVNDNAMNYNVTMLKSGSRFQPAYSNCPGTTGFNIIPLDLPATGTIVTANLKAIAPGSALHSSDAGTMVDGDGNTVGNATTYNQQSNTSSCFRFGFVSVNGTTATYGDMVKGSEGVASFTVPANAEKLYLVVAATPTTYNHHAWDDDESNDEQWPYAVAFGNTNLKGYIDVDPSKGPEDITLKYTLDCAGKEGYEIGTIDFSSTGDLSKICQAFGLSSSDLAAATTSNAAPAEGTVAFCLLQPDGTLASSYTSNAGYYIKADGSVGSWGNSDPVWTEYNGSDFILTYGQHAGAIPASGTTISVKPCLVYTKGGIQYKAVFELTMKF